MNIDSRRRGRYGIWQLKATTTTRWQVTGKKNNPENENKKNKKRIERR
jgi:hypothetical protein